MFDVLFVAFLLLPFVLLGWVEVFTKLNLPVTHTTLGVLIGVYVIAILVMRIGTERIQREERKYRTLKQKVSQYLQDHPQWDKASFNQIRLGLRDSSISNDTLEELIRRFSTHFWRGSFKRGNPAIGLVQEIGEEPTDNKK